MNYLIVVAHPDDEVLGAGATINKLVSAGEKVAVVILVKNASARTNLSATFEEDEKKAMAILGVEKVYKADFPNIEMNTVPHIKIVQYIEACIKDWKAEVIFTHHPSDVNIDHQETSKATIAACRLFQRTNGIPSLRMVAFMEVPSSTEWSLNVAENRFQPNLFYEVEKKGIDKKIDALKSYEGVMRSYPHPRSEQAIIGLATLRGSQSGCNFAEAYELVFRSEK